MFIKPTSKAKGSIFDIDDSIEPMLYPVDEDVPCPWDADIEVEAGKVYINGNLGPSGPRGAICRCECSVEDFTKYYKLEIHNSSDEGLMDKILSAGWERV